MCLNKLNHFMELTHMPVLVKKPHKHSASISVTKNDLTLRGNHVRSSSLDPSNNLVNINERNSLSENEQHLGN